MVPTVLDSRVLYDACKISVFSKLFILRGGELHKFIRIIECSLHQNRLDEFQGCQDQTCITDSLTCPLLVF